MKILGPEDIITERTSIVIGKFDGFHLGHRKLVRESGGCGFPVLVYRINKNSDRNLMTDRESADAADSLGVDYYVNVDLGAGLGSLSPSEFLGKIKDQYNVCRINVGKDFRFGSKASGDVRFLEEKKQEFGYSLNVIEDYLYLGTKVSSSRIRGALLEGDVESAACMLGTLYAVSGKVMPGKELGRSMGFPTANICTDKFLPGNGVYVTEIKMHSGAYYGITNVGRKPTVSGDGESDINVETNLFDFDGDIYGEEICVRFMKYIRPERKFSSIGELHDQIAADKDSALKMLNSVYKTNNL